MGMDKWL